MLVHCDKVCSCCGQGNPLFRCQDCGLPNYMCSACDERIHYTQPLHDREMWHNGYFEPISSMTNESTITQGKDVLYIHTYLSQSTHYRKSFSYSFNSSKILSPLWQRRNGYFDITTGNKNICEFERCVYAVYTTEYLQSGYNECKCINICLNNIAKILIYSITTFVHT